MDEIVVENAVTKALSTMENVQCFVLRHETALENVSVIAGALAALLQVTVRVARSNKELAEAVRGDS